EHRVIHDQKLRMSHAPPGAEIEAILMLRAFLAQTIAAVAGDFVPDGAPGLEVEIAARAIPGFLRPGFDRPELGELFLLREEAFVSFGGEFHPPEADVIGPAFDERGAEFARDDAVEERN